MVFLFLRCYTKTIKEILTLLKLVNKMEIRGYGDKEVAIKELEIAHGKF